MEVEKIKFGGIEVLVSTEIVEVEGLGKFDRGMLYVTPRDWVEIQNKALAGFFDTTPQEER